VTHPSCLPWQESEPKRAEFSPETRALAAEILPTRTGRIRHQSNGEAWCPPLGFRFAPRIRDLGDRRLYTLEPPATYPALTPLIGGDVDVKRIAEHWDDLLRLFTSVRFGTVTAAQARGVSAPERVGRGPARDGADRAHALRITLRHDSLYTYLQWTVRRFWAVSGP